MFYEANHLPSISFPGIMSSGYVREIMWDIHLKSAHLTRVVVRPHLTIHHLDRRVEKKQGEKHILSPKTDCQTVCTVKVLSKGLSFSDVKV